MPGRNGSRNPHPRAPSCDINRREISAQKALTPSITPPNAAGAERHPFIPRRCCAPPPIMKTTELVYSPRPKSMDQPAAAVDEETGAVTQIFSARGR